MIAKIVQSGNKFLTQAYSANFYQIKKIGERTENILIFYE